MKMTECLLLQLKFPGALFFEDEETRSVTQESEWNPSKVVLNLLMW